MSGERALAFECQAEQLIGVLHEPPMPRALNVGVLIVVGGPQYRVGSHRQFVLMARALAAKGYPVLRFDYRGMGDSTGAPRKFDAVDEDIRGAIDAFTTARPELRQIVLWGLCDGASAALIYGHRDVRVAGMIVANPWVHSEAAEAQSYIKHYYFRRLLQPSFWMKLLTLRVGVRASIVDFVRKLFMARAARSSNGTPARSYIERMLQGLRAFDGPVLVLLSERDLTARQFQDLVETPGSWRRAMDRDTVTLEHVMGTDHTFSNREGLQAATDRCLTWLEQLNDARRTSNAPRPETRLAAGAR